MDRLTMITMAEHHPTRGVFFQAGLHEPDCFECVRCALAFIDECGLVGDAERVTAHTHWWQYDRERRCETCGVVLTWTS